ncbi:hypothetical protein JHK82_028183 [Glycine max]|nr:hypothetical protein JHK85_028848 [Glycine max]KAG5004168.1 hypothetical protein JHK86_028307 [Glycine max]KAG5127348.1 hypothetical protein JHK82_028183 [Glycine max]KAG5151962.1 hypothetical protein JHK84_028434 [Glycine max]RZB87263.1 putative pentatricopeptide repeat-containing protein [Glycine soja]
MSHRNVVTWTAMIWQQPYECMECVSSNAQRWGEPHCFHHIIFFEGLCKGLKALPCGQLVHALAFKIGVQGSSIYIDNALMDMYATCCNRMDHARMVFDDITTKTDDEGALSLFSFSIAAKACASIGSGILGKQVNAAVVKHGFESNLPVMNSILDMYCKCHCASEEKQLFSEMTHKDTITWNTLIAGFEALDSRESLCIFS